LFSLRYGLDFLNVQTSFGFKAWSETTVSAYAVFCIRTHKPQTPQLSNDSTPSANVKLMVNYYNPQRYWESYGGTARYSLLIFDRYTTQLF
jgi:hypothetical protein